jgi:PAS domain S-box-containing protein
MEIEQIEKSHVAARFRFSAAVVAEQLSLLSRKRVDLAIHLVNAGIVASVLWPLYPKWLVLLWAALLAIVLLARRFSRRRYQRTPLGSRTAPRWGRIFVANTLVTGCLWGLTGSVVLVTPNPLYHVFIVFVLGGLMAGGIVSNAAYLPAMFAFMIPTILPVIVALFSLRDITHFEMGAMLSLFAVVLSVTGRTINRSIAENVSLRLRRAALVEQLRASEAVMATAQEMARVGSWELDLGARSYLLSREVYRILGVDPACFKPSSDAILARIHPDDRAAVAQDFNATLAAGTGRGIDHWLIMDNGAVKYVHERARVTYDAAGRPRRMVGTVQDITERRMAEDELHFANLLLQRRWRLLPTASCLWTRTGRSSPATSDSPSCGISP